MLGNQPIKSPRATLFLWGGVIALSALFIALWPQMKLKPDFKSMIMDSDKDRSFDQQTKEMFGDDEIIIVAVQNEQGVFDVGTLRLIDELTEKIKLFDGVRDIYSLTFVDNIRDEGGMLDINDLIEDLPTSKEEVAVIEERAGRNPMYWDYIVSPDKKVASIVIEPSVKSSSHDERVALTKKIIDLVDNVERPNDEKLYITGIPVSSYFGSLYMITDMIVFGALSSLVLIIVFWLIFRNWQGIVFTNIVAMAGVATTYGICSLVGQPVNMALSTVMVFVMALGMEYAIYVGHSYSNQFFEMRGAGLDVTDRKQVMSLALERVRGPVILSTLTTTVAFASMYTNVNPDLSKLGVFLAIGCVVCGLASLTFIPALIVATGFEVKGEDHEGHDNRLVSRLVNKFGGAAARNPGKSMLVMGLLVAVSVYGWTHLSVDSDAMDYFEEDSRVRMDEEFVRARASGTTFLQAVVVGKDRDTFKHPENLEKLAQLQVYTESLPNVTKVTGHSDHLKLLHRALRNGDDQYYKLPDSKAAVEQFLLLHKEPDDFRLAVNFEYSHANLMVRLDTMSSSKLAALEAKIEGKGKELFPGMDVNLIGTTMLIHRGVHQMTPSMVEGSIIAISLIWLILCIALRSIKFGTLALVPQLVPITMLYAVVAATGKPLDPPVSVTGIIVMGIAVDDTVHFFKNWMKRTSEGMSSYDGVISTLREIGRPMVTSSMVLGLGFGVMIFSRYGSLNTIGKMMFLATIVALICDLFVTPALLSVVKNKKGQEAGSSAPTDKASDEAAAESA